MLLHSVNIELTDGNSSTNYGVKIIQLETQGTDFSGKQF